MPLALLILSLFISSSCILYLYRTTTRFRWSHSGRRHLERERGWRRVAKSGGNVVDTAGRESSSLAYRTVHWRKLEPADHLPLFCFCTERRCKVDRFWTLSLKRTSGPTATPRLSPCWSFSFSFFLNSSYHTTHTTKASAELKNRLGAKGASTWPED